MKKTLSVLMAVIISLSTVFTSCGSKAYDEAMTESAVQNGYVIYDSGFNDYTFNEEIKIDVAGANDMVIELQEQKGAYGTLNVILGEFEINKLNK